MTSRDFGIVTLRNAVAYHFDGSIVPINNVYITSTNGAAIFSDTLTISTINVSTINGGGGVSSITAGTNISITGTVSTPIVNVDINSTLLMNGFPIYDNNTITIAAGSIINLSTLSTSIILNQATQGITMTSVPTTTIRGFTGTDDGILRVNGYVALYGSSTQLQIYDANGIIKGSLSYSYTDDDIHLNATQLLDLTGIQGVALTSQTGQRIRFNTVGGGNLDADIEGSITLTAGYSTSIGNINLYTASTSIVLDQASQSITLTANNDININASTLINGTIKVESTFYDNNASSVTSGQVLTAGTGGQVVWGSGGGSLAPITSFVYQDSGLVINAIGGSSLSPNSFTPTTTGMYILEYTVGFINSPTIPVILDPTSKFVFKFTSVFPSPIQPNETELGPITTILATPTTDDSTYVRMYNIVLTAATPYTLGVRLVNNPGTTTTWFGCDVGINVIKLC